MTRVISIPIMESQNPLLRALGLVQEKDVEKTIHNLVERINHLEGEVYTLRTALENAQDARRGDVWARAEESRWELEKARQKAKSILQEINREETS